MSDHGCNDGMNPCGIKIFFGKESGEGRLICAHQPSVKDSWIALDLPSGSMLSVTSHLGLPLEPPRGTALESKPPLTATCGRTKLNLV